jgi:hypothetical protein
MFTGSLKPAPTVDAVFGAQGRVVINADSAQVKVKKTPFGFVVGGLRIVGNLMAARFRKQAPSPFFNADGQPIRTPEVLSSAQRAALGANP